MGFFASLINSMPSAVAQGLIWGIMAIGVYLTYRILDVADLTVDGSLGTGGAVCVVMVLNGAPVGLALLAATAAGMLAGLVTGLFHTACGIPAILAGILTQLALYSVNLRIMGFGTGGGKANLPISVDKYGLLVSARYVRNVALNNPILILTIFCAVLIAVLYWFFGTELGCSLRATGANQNMARAQGINTNVTKVLGLMISNGLVALAGGLLAQLHMVDTSKPDWNAQLAALPPNCVMVGGPLQAPVFKQLQTSGMLEKRVFFAFMPSLLPGDEGVRAWRFFPSPQDQIDRLVSFVTEDLGLRTFGAFYPTDNYGPRMTGLLDQKLTGMGITLHSASYTPGQSSTWSGQAATLINPTTQENITAPIPQTQFEALFLPDSWKNMNLLTTSLMYNGEDRLVLLGTTLWEQGLDGKTVAEPDRYALAVFPAAWDATQAPAALRAPGTDFWVALGYDFVRFAVRMAFDSRPPAATVNAQAANMKIQWAMAPLSWDEKGIAHQKLHLFQPGANGMEPLDLTRFRNMREAILQRAALRMQGLPTVDEQGNSLIPGLPGMSAGPAVLNTPAATSPTPGVAPLSTTPQPSYKLRLSPATTGTTRTAR